MAKLPAMPVHPGDWEKDPGMKYMGLSERGLIFQMMLVMWEADPRGFYIVNGVVPSEKEMAETYKLSLKKFQKVFKKIKKYNIFTVCEKTGAYYSRRMVRDEEIRGKRKDAVKKRWDKEAKKGEFCNTKSIQIIEHEHEKKLSLNNKHLLFEKDFWPKHGGYPKESRDAKAKCLKKYQSIVKTEEDHEKLMIALRNYLHWVEMRRKSDFKELCYKNSLTWLNNWETDLERGPFCHETNEDAEMRQEKGKEVECVQRKKIEGFKAILGDIPQVISVFDYSDADLNKIMKGFSLGRSIENKDLLGNDWDSLLGIWSDCNAERLFKVKV